MTARLFGVGLGPGDPSLMTLRAVDVMRQADVLAIPQSNPHRPSLAWRICRDVLGEIPGQERIFLTFPMTKDPERLRPAWDTALAQLGERFADGKSVAFPTVGDPFTYSTYIYMHREVGARWPDVIREAIPGVTSITAVPAAAGVPLADGMESIAVLPASYCIDRLDETLATFDTTVLMKVSSVMPDVKAAIARQGLTKSSVYVSKATTGDQAVQPDLDAVDSNTCDYFSMVVVNSRRHSGVLAGRTPQSEKTS